MKAFAIDGDTTSHGGIIHATQTSQTHHGKPFLREGDGFYCPKCNIWSTIVPSNNFIKLLDKYIAFEGDMLTCGAIIVGSQTTARGANVGFQVFQQSPTNSGGILMGAIQANYGKRVQIIDEITQEPMINVAYEVIMKNRTITGLTDAYGFTQPILSDEAESVSLRILLDE